MEGLQLLTEKDLPYFKRMEEEGRAMIIELPIEQLLMIDPERWMKTETESISEEEVFRWLDENGISQPEDEKKKRRDEENKLSNIIYKSLSECLEGQDLTETQYEMVQWMIEEGFTEKQILKFITDHYVRNIV